MDKQTVREISNPLTNIGKICEEIDKIFREQDEWEARVHEREQISKSLSDRYRTLWKDNYRKLLNSDMDFDKLTNLEEDLRKWMHDLHTFTMKFSDDKLVYNLHWEAFHIGQLLGFVKMKTRIKLKAVD